MATLSKCSSNTQDASLAKWFYNVWLTVVPLKREVATNEDAQSDRYKPAGNVGYLYSESQSQTGRQRRNPTESPKPLPIQTRNQA